MPKGKYLTDAEKAVIDQLHALSHSNRFIAIKINRSECAVRHYLKLGANYGRKEKTRGNSKITKRETNQLIQLASKGTMTATQMIKELDLPISKYQVSRILKGTNHFKYTKRMTKPALQPRHQEARLEWAKKHVHWTTEWTNVVFSDEKKFNLDGPDGFSYYWHDLRKEPQSRYSRNFGGGTLMVWAAFSMRGTTNLCKISTRMNSRAYLDLLEDSLIPFVEDVMEDDFVFQQDNAAIHVSRESKEWFKDKDIEVLDWPARSPDLNPIENLWGILARAVYLNGRQFENLQQLEVMIRTEWRNLRETTLEGLINSMPGRVVEVVRRNGKQLSN